MGAACVHCGRPIRPAGLWSWSHEWGGSACVTTFATPTTVVQAEHEQTEARRAEIASAARRQTLADELARSD